MRIALDLLRNNQFYGKISKCDIYLTEVMFLGYVISRGRIAVDPSKTEAVTQWKAPQNPSKI